jgi:lipopolysaccharide transport system permease protein
LFFRDLERFITLGLMLMFYCTPILYSLDLIPQQYRAFVEGNPLSLLIICWRDLFMNGKMDFVFIGELYVYAFAMMLVGGWIFNKLKYRFAEIL